ncbi:hypothetical protein S40288_06895 [Stachybotrys chartarum IBT 40288]|nr:hypothetical protein S40288_06895 [Stachybotrys chartarum IBT 40288]
MPILSNVRLITVFCLSSASQTLLPGSTLVDAAATGQHLNHRIDGAPPTEVDVVVVGGGFSGIMSAYDLDQAGLKTVVLEAKEVIGGRSRSITRQSGPGIIELGATWINNITQPEVFALTEMFGLETAEQFTEGDSIVQGDDGRALRFPPGAPVSTDNETLAELEGLLYALIDEAAEEVDIHDFEFPAEKDVTLDQWVAQHNLWQHQHVRTMTSGLTTALLGREPHEIGAHYFLDYVKSGQGLVSLSSEGEFGAQSLKIKQGTTSIATNLAGSLTLGSVRVDTPVSSVTQHNDTVLVTAETGETFRAKKVIIAIPTNTYSDVTFSPALPCDKTALASQTKPGIYAKLIINYAEPWWRNAGLAGKFTSAVGPVSFGWETSDVALSQYSLAIFVAGDKAARWHELPEGRKGDAIIEHLTSLVGDELADEARNVLELNYVEWTLEEYLWGAPTNSMGPGLLRKYGAVLREPFGDVHFGGGETAYEWKGYLEGAVTAGQRAAKEVIEALSTEGNE